MKATGSSETSVQFSQTTPVASQMAAIFRIDTAGEWFFLSLYQWFMCLGPFGLPWVGVTLDLPVTVIKQITSLKTLHIKPDFLSSLISSALFW